jgi:hypothetical protein
MALQTTAPDVVAKVELVRVLAADLKTLAGDIKQLATDIKAQNADALTHLGTSDQQMSALTDAVGSPSLAAGSNLIGSVDLSVNGAKVGVGSTRVPVATAVSATPISRSSVTNTANTAKQLMAAKTDRVFLSVQNQDAAVDLWLNELGTANPTDGSSLRIPPGGLYEPPSGCVPVGAISIISTKANHQIYAREL